MKDVKIYEGDWAALQKIKTDRKLRKMADAVSILIKKEGENGNT